MCIRDSMKCDACLKSPHESYGWYAELAPGGQSYNWACDVSAATHSAADPAFYINSNATDAAGHIRACRCQYGDYVSPPPPPTPKCPGGSLEKCIDLCPKDPPAVFQACVAQCGKDCPH